MKYKFYILCLAALLNISFFKANATTVNLSTQTVESSSVNQGTSTVLVYAVKASITGGAVNLPI